MEDKVDTVDVGPEVVANGAPTGPETTPCALCGRRFIPERLPRHMDICQKTKQKKRQKFDSSKQRAVAEEALLLGSGGGGGGGGAAVTTPSSGSTNRAKPKKKSTQKQKVASVEEEEKPARKKSTWREQHEEFIRTVRAARGEKVEEPEKKIVVGEDGELMVEKYVPPGYVECPTCERNFNRGAAERHIPWCKEQKARIPKSPVANDAMARFKARAKYKAPTVRRGSKGQDLLVSDDLAKPRKAALTVNGARKVSQPENRRENGPPMSPPRKSHHPLPMSRVKARLMEQEAQLMPKTPVVKFKDKFPNHSKSRASTASEYFEEREQLKELLKHPDNHPNFPRTVPGVRTGGYSPTKSSFLPSEENDDLAKLKMRLEDMYMREGNGTSRLYKTPPNSGDANLPASGFGDIGTRGSTSGSSDGVSSQPPVSRGNSSEEGGGGRGSGVPRFCHQCGTKYPVVVAKYCYECGARRLGTVGPFLN